MVRRDRVCISAAIALLAATETARAADWNGAVSNNWFATGNWVSGLLPTSGTDAYISTTGSHGWPQLTGNTAVRVLRLGGASGASLDILGGGVLTANSSLIGGPIATSSNYTGIARISGGSLVTGFLDVGYSGTSAVTVDNGGILSVNYPTAGNTNFGNNAGSSGSLTVTGAGSQWLSTANAVIGNSGTGRVDILNGAYARINSAQLGHLAGGVGSLLIDGADTKVDLTRSYLVIGGAGRGNATISGGAKVSTFERFWLGNDPGGSGQLTVTGAGSALQATSPSVSFTIGYYGAGDVLIDNGGTISAPTTQMGLIAGSSGRLVVSGQGSRLVGTNSLIIGSRGAADVTLRDGGTASFAGRTATIGSLAGSTGVLNIGAAAGAAAANPGYLDAAGVQLGPSGNGKLVFNHLSENYTFAPAISGNGAIEQYAGFTTLTGDSSAFTGTTTVHGGRLIANGAFGGSLLIESGSRLGGTGAIGPTTVESGAIHAPGNSIGTQIVNGNYVNHGVLEIEATPFDHDRLIVNGGVDITGATLNLLLSPASSAQWPVIGSAFTVIENDGVDALTGTFSTVNSNLLFLDSIIDYAGGDGNDLAFSFNRNDVAYAALALTPNQLAVADTIDQLGFGNALWNAFGVSTDADLARAGFDLLSGEIHATVLGALVEDSRFVRDAAIDRLASISATDPAVWLRGYGSWRDVDGNSNAASYDSSTGGFLAGVDGDLADWRLGLLAGYGQTDLDVRQRQSGADIDSYSLGIYAGRPLGGASLRAGLAYSWQNVETRRSVSINGFTDSLSADYDTSALQGFAEIAYGLTAGDARFEPFANLAHVRVRGDGFSESGGAAALSSGRENEDATFTTIGIRAGTAIGPGNRNVSLSGTLAWRHAFGDVDPARGFNLAGAGSFDIAGTPIAENLAIVAASVNAQLSSAATLGIGYEGYFSGDYNDHNLKAELKVQF